MLASFVHSIKMYFIVYWFPHEHLGKGSSFRMKEWVNLVCPMHSRTRVVSSLLVLLGYRFRYLSFKMGHSWKSLLWGFFSHNCYHFFVIICVIFGLRSGYGIFDLLSGTILRAALANESALLFPWITIWLGIQQNIIFLLWFMELSLFRSMSMKGL